MRGDLQRYNTAKKQLVNTERAMLRELGFILHVDHPHKTVLNYLSESILDSEELMQEAWSLTNDRCGPRPPGPCTSLTCVRPPTHPA